MAEEPAPRQSVDQIFDWLRNPKKTRNDMVESIKQFCKLLSAHNVIRVEAYYDGCGDSGDLETISVVSYMTPAQIEANVQHSNNPAVTSQEIRNDWNRWVEKVTKEPNSLITREACDNFVDDLFALLPGGWEIDSGSYGDIAVTIADEKITIEHNERYTEVRTENFTY